MCYKPPIHHHFRYIKTIQTVEICGSKIMPNTTYTLMIVLVQTCSRTFRVPRLTCTSYVYASTQTKHYVCRVLNTLLFFMIETV